mgnify:CR=1 FL=1
MTTTVREWTGLEAKALRAALRMTIHEFADYLGVGTRTVAKWEARGRHIEPQPQTQAILDTALAKASGDVQARFTAAVSGSSTNKTITVDAAHGPNNTPTQWSDLVPQSGVLLPVVVDAARSYCR